ncbi:hypothetical protein [Devosia sp. LjRoot3]|uniref:hypothetical protein n=1 Tax=Devosia sp. LjRoot3 TaxID=3342319 RepID=UPI003ED0C24A
MQAISPRILDNVTTVATLLGIILAFDAIAQAYRNNEPTAWGVFGFVVATVSAISLFDRVLNVFGRSEVPASRMPRLVGGGMSLLLFLMFAASVGLFRFAN